MGRAFLLSSLAAALLLPAHAQNMFRGSLAHTGVYDTEGPRQLHGIRWKFQTNGWVISSPAVAKGLVYVGSDDNNLYAVEADSGKLKWKFETKGLVRCSPAVVNGVVYFGSFDGNFYAVDAATGQLKWKFATGGEREFEARGLHGYSPRTQTIPDMWDYYLSSPAVDQGIVYFGS